MSANNVEHDCEMMLQEMGLSGPCRKLTKYPWAGREESCLVLDSETEQSPKGVWLKPGPKGDYLAGLAMSDVIQPLVSLDFNISTIESRVVQACVGPEVR